jgi:hypothetical protein
VVALSGSFISSCPNRLNSRLRRKTGNLRPIGIHVRFVVLGINDSNDLDCLKLLKTLFDAQREFARLCKLSS